MDTWIIWLVASVAAAVGEMLTLGFFLAPFAAGALAGMVVDVAGGPGVLQVVVFAAVTAAAFAAVRPVARRHLRTPARLRTGTAALVGRSATVLEAIANDNATGTVRLDGEVWTARAYDDDLVIEAGTRVQVLEIRGATALVAP